MSQLPSRRDRINKAKHEVLLILENALECDLENGERRRIEERGRVEWLLHKEHKVTEAAAKTAIDELVQGGYLVELPCQSLLPLQFADGPIKIYPANGLTTTDKEWMPQRLTEHILDLIAERTKLCHELSNRCESGEYPSEGKESSCRSVGSFGF